jgi:hypothetical protein
MREQELIEFVEQVRALEQTNLDINEKLNAAHVADATTFTYYFKFIIKIIFSSSSYRNTFITELFTDDMATNIANNSLLAVDLGELTIRSDVGEKTFEQLLSKLIKQELQFIKIYKIDELDQNTPRLPTIEDEDVRNLFFINHDKFFFQTIVAPMANLQIEGTHMHVKSPPTLNEEEQRCLDFKGPTWIDTARLKQALRKT